LLRAPPSAPPDYLAVIRGRGQLKRSFAAAMRAVDVLVMPTVPLLAPRQADLEEPEAFLRANRLLVRNTSIANFFDLCAISLPASTDVPLPVGFMLTAPTLHDALLLSVAKAVEQVLNVN